MDNACFCGCYCASCPCGACAACGPGFPSAGPSCDPGCATADSCDPGIATGALFGGRGCGICARGCGIAGPSCDLGCASAPFCDPGCAALGCANGGLVGDQGCGTRGALASATGDGDSAIGGEGCASASATRRVCRICLQPPAQAENAHTRTGARAETYSGAAVVLSNWPYVSQRVVSYGKRARFSLMSRSWASGMRGSRVVW